MNHIITGNSRDRPFSELRERVRLAVDVGADLCRGPAIPPWMLRKQVDRDWLKQAVRILGRDLDLLVIVEPDPETAIEGWAQHCRVVARDYPAKFYEIMNEPDNAPAWPPGRYARWLAVASDAILSVRPDAKICAPALGHGRYWTMEDYFRALRAIRGKWHIATVHPYGRGWPYLRKVMELTDAPILISEDGVTSNVAAAICGAYKEYLSHRRIIGVVWFALNASPPDDPRYNLVGADLIPKPAYKTFGELGRR